MAVKAVGYKGAMTSPDQLLLACSFDTNNTGTPDGVRGKVSVARSNVGVFVVTMNKDPNIAAGDYDRFDSIVLQPATGGVTDPNLYIYRVTAVDASLAQPTITITQYIRTYAAGAIDTYAAGDSTDIKINVMAVLHKTDPLAG